MIPQWQAVYHIADSTTEEKFHEEERSIHYKERAEQSSVRY